MSWPATIRSRWVKFWQPKPLGYLGERAVEKHLKRQGYKIVARGLRLRGGELDLVAVENRTVVFVEVKTRRTAHFGLPQEAVDSRKQWRLTRAALFYLKRHGLLEYPARFDVVAVTWPHQAKRPTIEHFQNAFEATGVQGMYS
ncbi:MAG TPA: YraN family protein [Pirellulales bacterium]|jgi:putative endonuclease|nr:YraN family protein [Pirellulales bacterium]